MRESRISRESSCWASHTCPTAPPLGRARAGLGSPLNEESSGAFAAAQPGAAGRATLLTISSAIIWRYSILASGEGGRL